jgi:tetratricopeptide (TPR) repeat protein
VVRRQDANELTAGFGWPSQAKLGPFSAKPPLGAGGRTFLMRRLAVTPILLTMAAAALLSGCSKLQARMELNKGTSYYKNEKYQDALIQFQKGLALDPGLKRHWRSVALSAMVLYRPGVDTPDNMKYYTITVDAFKKYLEAYPQDAKAQDYLIATFVNANKYEEVLKYLQEDLKKHPGDIKDHKAIVSIYLRTQRIQEAYDWIVGHIPNAEAEPYYLVSVYSWDKANRDPSLTPEDRSKFVELGLKSVDKAVKMQPEYFDAMVYYNLLYREKAKLQTDEKVKQEYFDKADEWRNKALALREKLKKQTSFAKS